MQSIISTFFCLLLPVVPVTASGTCTLYVNSLAAFNDAQNSLTAGDTIIWSDGTYGNVQMNVTEPQLTILAQTPGRVIFNGDSGLTIRGNRTVVSGLQFVGGDVGRSVIIRVKNASNVSLSQINVRDYICDKYLVVNDDCQYVDIAYCNFEQRTNYADKNILSLLINPEQPGFHSIRYCSFKNFPGGGADEGVEPIRIGTDNRTSEFNSRCLVEYCYFTKCNGDGEIISSKGTQNVYRFNTFEDNEKAELVLRSGSENIVYGNFFIRGKGGVRIKEGQQHYIYNNYFYQLEGRSIILEDFQYDPLEEINIAFNTIVDCGSMVLNGTQHPESQPSKVRLANNLIINRDGKELFTQATGTETWLGNVVAGTLGIMPPNNGLNQTDVLLDDDDAFPGISAESPAINAAVAGFARMPQYAGMASVDTNVVFDLLHRMRPENIELRDVGATEFPTDGPIRPIATEANTGPSYNTSLLNLTAANTQDEPGDSSNYLPRMRPASPPTITELIKNFRSPPTESRPRTWYHAMSGNMSKAGITKDLEAMAEVGIGGLLLFNVSSGIPDGDVIYDSEEHHAMLTHAASECERLDLSFGVHNCDGWSSSAGPWVTPEQSMKMIVYSETIVEGGKQISIPLGQPTIREGFYEDIAVLAFPSLPSDLADRDNPPIVTTSNGQNGMELITDGRVDEHLLLPVVGDTGPWVQYAYATPVTIRSVFVNYLDRNVVGILQSSDDGINWADVRQLHRVRPQQEEWILSDRFEPVTAPYFRVQFNRSIQLLEAKLSNRYTIEDPLSQIALARQEDVWLEHDEVPPSGAVIPADSVLVLTEFMSRDGELAYDLPAGNWTIVRFGQTATGAVNAPASPAGRGLELDKMSRAAFKVHYDAFVAEVIDNTGPVAPNALQYMEIDSYEKGGQNWTDGFDSIFQARNGYDLIPYLPLITGRFMERSSTHPIVAERGQTLSSGVLFDFRSLISDLFTENYFQYFTELCHQDGILSYIEPYGNGPVNHLDVAGVCDIPMGEFWTNKTWGQIQGAVSGAHIYGKPVISAESFTSAPAQNWDGHPAQVKINGDSAWAVGINEFMFHRFAHQANTHVKPGMTMNRWGFNFDRTQTWWYNAGKDYFSYLARGSYLLRQGIPVSDLMVFVGDGAPNSTFDRRHFKPEIPLWLNYDIVNTDVLLNRVTLTDGHLELPEGGRYPLLNLKNSAHLRLTTLRRIVEIAESGVTVVGDEPAALAGEGHTIEDYQEFAELSARLTAIMQPVRQWEDLLTGRGLAPDLIATGSTAPITYQHRRVGDTEIYFFSNLDKEPKAYTISASITGKRPERWDAMTGEIRPVNRYRQVSGRTELQIDLDSEESFFLVFRSDVAPAPSLAPSTQAVAGIFDFDFAPGEVLVDAAGKYALRKSDGTSANFTVPTLPSVTTLTAPWQVEFREEDGYNATLEFPTLTDWTDHEREDIRHYSGTATYRTQFGFQPESNVRYYLDLGEVDVVAEVKVNGQDMGIRWMKPFRLDITDALTAGKNVLEVAVTNQWSNRLIGDEQYPKQDDGYIMRGNNNGRGHMPNWYKNNEPMPQGPRRTFTTANFYSVDEELRPSGLKGPVRIMPLRVMEIGR